ncbi:polysaccharide deacetylase family protein [Thiomonas sp.]|uniref:polysaccharide deacetylase family protein n=1 Tax=Thiomonas sp. TaxID=2047785 RepID=UPI0026139BB1|nr:polysaccharide deacetylase family protein [Thiomonas sp.]
MKRLSILMYHALYADDAQRLAIDAADRPYAISAATFARQLDLLREQGVPVIHPAVLERPGATLPAGVLLTFDDGHASNVDIALPLLERRGMHALFFITTGFVGRRPGFCDWDAVRALARHGMVIGGHGHSHRFLSDLPTDALHTELEQSRSLLQQALQTEVRQMSFPGGRYDARSLRAAARAGFSVLHGSDTGALAAASPLPSAPLPRLAVRAATSDTAFLAMATASPGYLLRAQAADSAKSWAKRLLGNQRYHRLYTRLKGAPTQRP